MGRPKKNRDYRQAVEQLRQKHFDKLESIFLAEYAIVMNPESDDRDKNNASKVCSSILGVPRTGIEKQDTTQKDIKAQEKPTLSEEHNKVLDDILGKL